MIWLLQNVVFSISLIVILHYLYIYFKATLTSPRVKDLIHCPKQKYESLFDTIERGNRESTDFPSIVPQGSSLGIPAHLTMHSNNLPYTSQHNNASGDDSSNINNPNHQFSDNTYPNSTQLQTQKQNHNSHINAVPKGNLKKYIIIKYTLAL
jgi:hypothetical protein